MNLPVAIYDLGAPGRPQRLGACDLARLEGIVRPCEVVFFAPDRSGPGLTPVYKEESNSDGARLRCGGSPTGERPFCYAVSPDTEEPPKATIGLHEFVAHDGKRRAYATADRELPGFAKAEKPLCLVWPSPTRLRFTPGAPLGSEEAWGPPDDDADAMP